jgi:succinate dehydrogenase hydrophobic anchor subunit
VIATDEELFDIQKQFKKKFQWMTMELASMHSYLGLQIMIQDGTVEVVMSFS